MTLHPLCTLHHLSCAQVPELGVFFFEDTALSFFKHGRIASTSKNPCSLPPSTIANSMNYQLLLVNTARKEFFACDNSLPLQLVDAICCCLTTKHCVAHLLPGCAFALDGCSCFIFAAAPKTRKNCFISAIFFFRIQFCRAVWLTESKKISFSHFLRVASLE